VAALQLISFGALTVRLPDTEDKIAFMVLLKEGERFSLTYRHSVEKTLVKGVFQVSGQDAMRAVETRMTSVGTGLPNTFPSRTRREGKWMVVDEKNRFLPPFRFFIQPINQTVLAARDIKFDLTALPAGTVVRIGVENLALHRVIIHQVMTYLKR